ncbi:hypothetical protein G7085_06475 [Tessaracoccus sp. HDW20]|uniref:hypothetical protein n=1 Tax=Tessaracoccus coleopterorum TaxID=2714950 RepID=UPI0018D4629B|nr:hypothetical protein [Tessaracoccus coleopterorum]NHB84373.1 hypothetical protein [Tessaracoccus coleopterorum]
MGMVHLACPREQLEGVGLEWAAKICRKSPTAQRMLKYVRVSSRNDRCVHIAVAAALARVGVCAPSDYPAVLPDSHFPGPKT